MTFGVHTFSTFQQPEAHFLAKGNKMSTEDEEEREHWWNVMRTFLFYSEFVEMEVARRQNHLSKLKPAHYNRLPQITFDKLGMLMQAAEVNQGFFDGMVKYHASNSFLAPPEYALTEGMEGREEGIYPTKDVGPIINITQHHRNNAVLHSLLREWSTLGAQEREESMGMLLTELTHRLPILPLSPSTSAPTSSPSATGAFQHRVLVPGCGLGRLALEVAAKGYRCEGNEFSA
ncbi:hypothetical protein EON63_10815 [archaeon]|nr:MAG: hypothetical protein EON63_10815 [archaeon]